MKKPARVKPPKKGTAMRCDAALIAKLDEYAAYLEKAHGVRITRTAAFEAVVRLGLKAANEAAVRRGATP